MEGMELYLSESRTESNSDDLLNILFTDGGFFMLDPPIMGRFLIIKANQPKTCLELHEIRVYEIKNFMSQSTIFHSPEAESEEYAANNLLENLGNRSNKKTSNPYRPIL